MKELGSLLDGLYGVYFIPLLIEKPALNFVDFIFADFFWLRIYFVQINIESPECEVFSRY